GQPRVFRSYFAARPLRGLGFVEVRTRGIHQGWKVFVLSTKAAYMSATEPSLVIINNRLAKRERSICVAKFLYRQIKSRAPSVKLPTRRTVQQLSGLAPHC